jgi:hypothetical protein
VLTSWAGPTWAQPSPPQLVLVVPQWDHQTALWRSTVGNPERPARLVGNYRTASGSFSSGRVTTTK